MGDLNYATERFGQRAAASACRYAAELLLRYIAPKGDGKPGCSGWSAGVKACTEELYRVALNHDARVREIE